MNSHSASRGTFSMIHMSSGGIIIGTMLTKFGQGGSGYGYDYHYRYKYDYYGYGTREADEAPAEPVICDHRRDPGRRGQVPPDQDDGAPEAVSLTTSPQLSAPPWLRSKT